MDGLTGDDAKVAGDRRKRRPFGKRALPTLINRLG
jgi:hypothetical protein